MILNQGVITIMPIIFFLDGIQARIADENSQANDPFDTENAYINQMGFVMYLIPSYIYTEQVQPFWPLKSFSANSISNVNL